MVKLLLLLLLSAGVAHGQYSISGPFAISGPVSVGVSSATFTPPSAVVVVGETAGTTGAANALWQGATEQWWRGPQYCEAGGRKLAIGAYLTNDTTDGTTAVKDVIVWAWDYAIGALASAHRIDTNYDGSSTHNRPFVALDADSYVHVYYGAEAAFGTKSDGVYYRISATPCALDFGAEQNARAGGVAVAGGLAQFTVPVLDGDGVMHFFVQSGSNNGGLFKRATNNTWTDTNPNVVNNSNGITCGVPQPFSLRMFGSNGYLAWTSSNSAGVNRGVYLLKTTDKFVNFTNVAGTNGFASTSDLADSNNTNHDCGGGVYLRSWNSNYQVDGASVEALNGPMVAEASNGDVVILVGRFGSLAARRYTSSWQTDVTVVSATTGGHDLLRVGNDLVAVFLRAGAVYYKKSTDHGATWGTETLVAALEGTTGISTYRHLGCSVATPSGQSTRVLCGWSAQFNIGSSTPTKHDEVRFFEFVP